MRSENISNIESKNIYPTHRRNEGNNLILVLRP